MSELNHAVAPTFNNAILEAIPSVGLHPGLRPGEGSDALAIANSYMQKLNKDTSSPQVVQLDPSAGSDLVVLYPDAEHGGTVAVIVKAGTVVFAGLSWESIQRPAPKTSWTNKFKFGKRKQEPVDPAATPWTVPQPGTET
tara:strand:+ start:460 stop:879 length:420 start_codon:yes stop_codon:yes gene_type:complete